MRTVIILTIKQLKRRVVQGLIEPELFYMPWEENKKTHLCTLQFKTYSIYDTINKKWESEISTSVSIIIASLNGKVLYNSKKTYINSVLISLATGKYRIKVISSKSCKINQKWQEFTVTDNADKQTFSFYLERQDFYKVKVITDKNATIPMIILQNKDDTKIASKIYDAYGTGVIYNDYYNYFTNEQVFLTPTLNSTQISGYDLGYSKTITNNVSTNALLYGMPFTSFHFTVDYKDAFNNTIQTSEITETSCAKSYYNWSYKDNKSITSPISYILTSDDKTNYIDRYYVTWLVGGGGTTYYYDSRVNIKVTYPQQAEISGVDSKYGVFSNRKGELLRTYLQLAYDSDFSNDEYNGYYSAIYLPFDTDGNCEKSNATLINNLNQYNQLIEKYAEEYDSTRLFINNQREIPNKIIDSDIFKMVKKYGNINSISYNVITLILEDGQKYRSDSYSPTILTDAETNEEYFYDSTTITQYSEDYEYWINQ